MFIVCSIQKKLANSCLSFPHGRVKLLPIPGYDRAEPNNEISPLLERTLWLTTTISPQETRGRKEYASLVFKNPSVT